MNILNHAKMEFRAAGWCNEQMEFVDPMQKAICGNILELLEVFSKQGHSGTTASYVSDLFNKLSRFQPIVPLTGEDWEWNEVSPGNFQNRRCSAVFKGSDRFDGQPYYLDAVVFWEWYTDPTTGEKFKSYFTNRDSQKRITFPYTPETVYEEYKGD